MRVVRRAAALTHVASNRVARSKEAEPTPAPPRRGPDETTGAERPDARRQSAAATPDEDEEISVSGGDVIMRSVLIDAISSADEGPKDRREVAALANAWARLNQGRMEEEKLKLKTESKLEMAFKELSKDVRSDPEAKELFQKLYDVVKRLEEEKAGKMARN